MDGILGALLLALMPAGGYFLGGLVAEVFPISRNALNYALHAAAGIIIVVVAVEIMPGALATTSVWAVVLGLVLGAVFYVLLELALDKWAGKAAPAWMIYAGVALDLFSDGLLIGTGSAVSSQLAFVLALGQVTADIPEGFATIANFRKVGMSRGKRILLSASFVIPVVGAAALSYLLLRGQGDALKYGTLSFTAGILLLAAVEEMIQEAHESSCDNRYSAIAFIGGFCLFVLVSQLMG